MSDELKIELQVDTDTESAESKLDNLINEYNKKPINLRLNLGDTDIETFQNNIKGMTSDLKALSELNFDNLKSIEKNLKSISKVVGEYKNLTSDTKLDKDSFKSGLLGLEDINFDRLSGDHKEALSQIKLLQSSAVSLKEGFKEYKDKLKEASDVFEIDNVDFFKDMKDIENAFDTTVFKKLVAYQKEFNSLTKEYYSLGVDVIDKEAIRNYDAHAEKFHTSKWKEYADLLGMSEERVKEAVQRAKEIKDRQKVLYGNLERNLKKASEAEKSAIQVLQAYYDNMPSIDTTSADKVREKLVDIMGNDVFKLDFSNLDMRFEDDFEKAYEMFFKILKDVQEEYNRKFKDTDGFEGFNIFDIDSLADQNDKLDKEVEETVSITKKLKNLGEGALDTLGISANSLDAFEVLAKSAEELEAKLNSLKDKFSKAFEISGDSAKSLDKIKEALIEINKLTEEQKQTFFDFGLDADNIKKAKDETKELKEAVEKTADISFDGLMESYSKIESATGKILSETERLRTSAMSTVTLSYRYEENSETGESEKKLSTLRYTEEISKRTKQLIKEYSDASKDLIKAKREYFEALNGGKASEGTVDKLSENVQKMESNLAKIRSNINELEDYPDVIDKVFESFNELDEIRNNQIETDSLKIIDKADLEQANKLLKETKILIDNVSKDNIQLQKDTNAKYETSAAALEERIKLQEKRITNNLSKLVNIPNSKAAVDQIFAYQLEKAHKTQIEIARIQDKANKTTGTKTVDVQDQYLKEYKRYLTELKSIGKSLANEKNDDIRSKKIFDLSETFKQLELIKSKLNEVKSEVANDLFNKTMRELDLSLSNAFSKTSTEIEKVEEKIIKLSRSDYVDKAKINEMEAILTSLKSKLGNSLDDLGAEAISDVLVKLEKLKKEVKSTELDIKLSKDSEKIETFIKGVTDQLEILQNKSKDIDVSHITKQFKELTAGSDRNSTVMKSITDDVKALEKNIKLAGSTAKTAGTSFKGFFDDLGDSLRTFTLGEMIGDFITDSLYQTWDVIREMESAMASLKKVADVSDVNTSDKLDNIRSQAINVSKEVGMASSDVINAIADTLQAGIGSMQESIQVARSAMILANVGDMTQEAASQALNTIINGYKIDPLKEIGVEVNGLTQQTTELANAMDLLNYAG